MFMSKSYHHYIRNMRLPIMVLATLRLEQVNYQTISSEYKNHQIDPNKIIWDSSMKFFKITEYNSKKVTYTTDLRCNP